MQMQEPENNEKLNVGMMKLLPQKDELYQDLSLEERRVAISKDLASLGMFNEVMNLVIDEFKELIRKYNFRSE